MYRFNDVTLRKFTFEDIPLKIQWVNQIENNQYLGYELPLKYEKTCQWFENVKNCKDRFDAVVEYKGIPVGLFGLLNIDYKNKKAEEYNLIGDLSYRGKGIATKADQLLFIYAYFTLGLNKLYGKIEVDNTASLKQWFRLGGHVEGYLKDDVWKEGKPIDVYAVAHYKREFKIPEGAYEE